MHKLEYHQIVSIWKNKLLNNFNPLKEIFNLYIDSPFCTSPKCDFCIYCPKIMQCKEDVNLKNKYYDYILPAEINKFGEILRIRSPTSIYFGGGTSSLMTLNQMKNIFKELNKYFDFLNAKEKHFEMNPLSATNDKLQLLINWKFTHITFGVQTFNKDVLKFNKRINVPISRLKEISKKLDNNKIKYNLDLLMFIYKDNMEEDLEILESDLEIMGCEINPARITIFPNYKLLNKKMNNGEKEYVYQLIRSSREIIKSFEKKYNYKDMIKLTDNNCDDELETNFILNPQLVRLDFIDVQWELYNSSAPWNLSCPVEHSVLALGGFGDRKPYSYIQDKIAYNNHIYENRVDYIIEERTLRGNI